MHVIFRGPEFAYAGKPPRCSDRQKELVPRAPRMTNRQDCDAILAKR
jgi:hypothetical protein